MDERKSDFLSQVAEQPARLRDLAEFYSSEEGLCLLAKWRELARAHGGILFTGMGTSEYAPLLVKHLLLEAGLQISIEDAGELHYYYLEALAHGSLPVLISQSGESVETRRLAVEDMGCCPSIVALTNDVGSTIAQRASLVLPMCAGPETAISTKTYVNTLALVYLMAQSLLGDEALAQGIDAVRQVAALMAVLDLDEDARRAAAFLLPLDAIQFIARGPSVVAARQAALTFMEGAKLPSTALTAGAFRHGPFELVREGHRAVFFAPAGETLAVTFGLAQECAAKGSRVLLLTDADLPATIGPGMSVLRVPGVDETLFPILAAVPQAFLLHYVALGRGFVAGIFERGQKVTTRE